MEVNTPLNFLLLLINPIVRSDLSNIHSMVASRRCNHNLLFAIPTSRNVSIRTELTWNKSITVLTLHSSEQQHSRSIQPAASVKVESAVARAAIFAGVRAAIRHASRNAAAATTDVVVGVAAGVDELATSHFDRGYTTLPILSAAH